MYTITLIVPIYNEQQSIELFYNEVMNKLKDLPHSWQILFINDGSTDDSEQQVIKITQKDKRVRLLSFTRNFGKEAALFAGLSYAQGDAVIPLDVDLQDPIEVIPQLVQQWDKGFKMVLAKRSSREEDSWIKRITASLFYRFYNQLSYIHLEENVGDFRLIDRSIVQEIIKLPENKVFMKGIFAWAAYDVSIVEYKRPARQAGLTKFNAWKLWNLAIEGVTSFSHLPLRIWSYIGFFIAFFSFCYAVILILDKLFNGNPVAGYPSIMVSILFLGGVQLIGIGVLGEYIGRIYEEVKNRPKYIIRKNNETLND